MGWGRSSTDKKDKKILQFLIGNSRYILSLQDSDPCALCSKQLDVDGFVTGC